MFWFALKFIESLFIYKFESDIDTSSLSSNWCYNLISKRALMTTDVEKDT